MNNDYKRMMDSVAPSEQLVRKTKTMMKEDAPMMKNRTRFAATLVAAVILISATAFATFQLLKPADIATRFQDSSLAAALESDGAMNINETVTSGDYTVTLLAIVSGDGISDGNTYANSVLHSDRTYAAIAIERADGTPIERDSPPEFYVSPYIKGEQPWMFNAHTLNGGHIELVEDGILYRIVECDTVAIFADRGLYLGVTSTSFFSADALNYDAETGVLTSNSDFSGTSIVFDLPFDSSLADPEAAAQYIADMFG